MKLAKLYNNIKLQLGVSQENDKTRLLIDHIFLILLSLSEEKYLNRQEL